MDDLKAVLDKIDTEIAEVKRQYDFFIQGVRKTEPLAERRALEGTIRRIGQRKIVNSADQFRFNSLQGRFFAFANLWSRAIRDIEEGRPRNDAAGPPGKPEPEPKRTPIDPARLDETLSRLLAARRECGLPEGDEAAIRETLLRSAREISQKAGGREVEFRICVENGKPKVKASVK